MAILITLGMLLTMAFSAIIDGWVLNVLWKWFIVSIFHLPQISIAQATGIVLIMRLLTMEPVSESDIDEDKHEDIEKFSKNCFSMMLKSTRFAIIFLILGWIVHLFI